MWTKFLLLFFVFSFLFRADLAFDQDLGRHLKLGEIITKSGQVPKTNLFSYTHPGFPFINTHWLFEVIAYLFSQTVGLQAFLILKVAIFLLSVWLVLSLQKSVLLLPVGFIFLHVLRERMELRPEIFSFLFTALTLYILEKKPKFMWLLPLIQLVWINTHIYFFVGFIIQAIFILSSLGSKLFNPRGWIRSNLRTQASVFIISVLISLINPNGLAGFLYPANVTKNYGYTIVENQTMFLLESINFKNPNFLFVKLSWAILVISLVITFLRKQFNLKNILLSLAGLGLSVFNVRGFPYLVFISLPAVIQNFTAVKPNIVTKLLTTIFAGVLIFESLTNLGRQQVGLSFKENVRGAMDFVLANDLPGPIYNNFDIGSYIIYRGYPKYQVFVDGRPEAYPKEFFLNTYIPMQSDYEKFKKEEKKWNFKTIIFSRTDQTPWGRNFLQSVAKDEDWQTVYLDDSMVVLLKKK